MIPRMSKLSKNKNPNFNIPGGFPRKTFTGDISIRQDIYQIIKHLDQKHVLFNYDDLNAKEKEELQGQS